MKSKKEILEVKTKEELKTLKDMTSWVCECNCVSFHNGICKTCGKKPKYGTIDYEELRAEVVKWIKDRQKVIKNPIIIDTEKLKAIGMIRDFQDFFNISEEELKGEKND